MSDKYLDSAGLAAYNALVLEEALRSPAQTVSSSILNLSNGRVFKWTVTANSTMTFSGTPKRQVDDIWLMLATQGDYFITWPSNVTWIDKIPIIGPYEDSIYKFTTLDGGTSWLGFCMKDSNHAWMFTVDTEATAAGEKKTGIPLNLYGQTGVTVTVNWGDGNTSTLTSADYTASNSTASVHEYAAAGRYTVLMKSDQWDDASLLTISSNSDISTVNDSVAPLYWWRRTLVKVDLPLPKVYGRNYYSSPTSVSSLGTRSNSFGHLFCNCNKLKNVCKGLFDNNTAVIYFYDCFYNCTSLTAIPAGLFNNNTKVTSFSSCFYNCTSLTAIPSGLFDSNTKVTNFDSCFCGCTSLTAIPAGLFDSNTAVTNFSYCFYNCTSLTAIPAGLFDSNTAVTNFSYCFYNCTSLTAIPAGLFDNNTAVTTFTYCFRYCTSLAAIPAGLFDNNTAVTDFSDCFYKCTSLAAIPAGLFDNNTAVTTFSDCFLSCTSLSTIPTGLFDNNTAVTDFTFCFSGCSSLTAIPSSLFDNNTAVTSFGYCFSGCSSLTAIPAGLFDNNTAVRNFYNCFGGCTSLTAIPAGLFDNNTAATNFGYCFNGCTSLAAIPAGLFDNNTAATDFRQCFYQCSSLADFTLHIGSSSVSNCSNFVTKKSGTTRTVYVPSGSTTQTKFNAVASSLGLTIVGE